MAKDHIEVLARLFLERPLKNRRKIVSTHCQIWSSAVVWYRSRRSSTMVGRPGGKTPITIMTSGLSKAVHKPANLAAQCLLSSPQDVFCRLLLCSSRNSRSNFPRPLYSMARRSPRCKGISGPFSRQILVSMVGLC